MVQLPQALAAARLEYAGSDAERAKALADALAAAKDREATATKRFKAALTSDLDVYEAKAYRLRVEIMVAEAAAKGP